MKAIAAMSINRVIGKDGKLPWHIKEDLKFFKQHTLDGYLVVGRKTFDSISFLKRRNFIVLTRNREETDKCSTWQNMDNGSMVIFKHELPEIPENKNVWLAGGATIYEQFLPRCSELYLTIVKKEVEGDTYMPAFEHLFKKDSVIFENEEIRIELYKKLETV